MKRSDVRAFLNRRWDKVAAAKDAYWIAELEKLSLTEAYALADGLRVSAIQLNGPELLEERDEDLADLISLTRLIDRANAARRH
jgi:hypothetical protein